MKETVEKKKRIQDRQCRIGNMRYHINRELVLLGL